MQWFVNQAPDVLNDRIGVGPIDWRSPLASDEYAEAAWRARGQGSLAPPAESLSLTARPSKA
jgi:hypothetical protein